MREVQQGPYYNKWTFLLVGLVIGIFIEEKIGSVTRQFEGTGNAAASLPQGCNCEALLFQQQQRLAIEANAASAAAMKAAAAAASKPCSSLDSAGSKPITPSCPPPPLCPVQKCPLCPILTQSTQPQQPVTNGAPSNIDEDGRVCCKPSPRALSKFAPNNFGFTNPLQLDPVIMLERLVAMMPGKKRWYIQIGAHASAQAGHNDPTEKFFEQAGWSGLLVEPVPQIHELLDSFVRASERPLKTANVAICPKETAGESLTFYSIAKKVNVTSGKIAGERKVPHWLSQLGSLEKERIMQYKHWVKGNRTIEDLIEEIKVECLTVPNLLQRYSIPPEEVVAMVIDAQGQDSKIVQDLTYNAASRFRPAFIIYEHVMFRHPERQVTVAHLWKFGYTCWYHNGNTWCIKLGAT